MKKLILLLCLLLCLCLIYSGISSLLLSQPLSSPSCKLLDANTIITPFCNNGIFNNQWEWPRGTGGVLRGSSGLWIGANVYNPATGNTDTLVTVCFFQSEFLPGYTDNNGIPHGKDDPLYRVYKLILDRNDSDRSFWPNILLGNSDQGAPVYYDTLAKAWRPCDIGDQTIYYVYTDSYPQAHTNLAGSTRPLKADIKQLNFAFDLNGPLGQICFSQFTIINRSTQPWHDAWFSVWSDDQIGYPMDDNVGCDSALNLGYSFNGESVDPEYGIPPAVGFLVLKGAAVHTGNRNDTAYSCYGTQKLARVGWKDLRMSAFSYFINSNDPQNGNPTNYRESYRYMQGLKRDGTCRRHPVGNFCTRYPNPFGWNSMNGDYRILVSSGPVTVNPGDSQTIIIAQLVARGSSNLASVYSLRQIAMLAQRIYDACVWGCVPAPYSPPPPIEHFHLYQNYPNPFNAKTTIKVDIADLGVDIYPNVLLRMYDVLGRELTTLKNEPMKPGQYNLEFDATLYPSGVYFYELTISYRAPQNIVYNKTRKMLLLK